MINKTILETALKFMPIASSDPTRYMLCGVNIVSAGGKVTLTATNGHMLVTRDIKGNFPDGEYMIFRDDAPILKLVLKESKPMNDIHFTLLPDKSLLVGTFNAKLTIKPTSTAGDYPNYKQVIPATRGETRLAFDAEYLLDLAVAMNDGNKRFQCTVDVDDPAKPIFVSVKGEHAETTTAVLMPCRL